MKSALLLLAVSFILLSISLSSVLAKCATLGIYAIVDQVTFEPNGSEPNCVRIAGIFVVPFRMSSGDYQKPQRGYLYFKIAPGAEQETRRDWKELKTVAGSGKLVAFGQYWVPNPLGPNGNPHHSLEVTVHAEGEGNPTPDVYPIPLPGVVHNPRNTGNDCAADKIAEQLQKAWRH